MDFGASWSVVCLVELGEVVELSMTDHAVYLMFQFGITATDLFQQFLAVLLGIVNKGSWGLLGRWR